MYDQIERIYNGRRKKLTALFKFCLKKFEFINLCVWSKNHQIVNLLVVFGLQNFVELLLEIGNKNIFFFNHDALNLIVDSRSRRRKSRSRSRGSRSRSRSRRSRSNSRRSRSKSSSRKSRLLSYLCFSSSDQLKFLLSLAVY